MFVEISLNKLKSLKYYCEELSSCSYLWTSLINLLPSWSVWRLIQVVAVCINSKYSYNSGRCTSVCVEVCIGSPDMQKVCCHLDAQAFISLKSLVIHKVQWLNGLNPVFTNVLTCTWAVYSVGSGSWSLASWRSRSSEEWTLESLTQPEEKHKC